nr:aldehyde dehydrogenase family protein [Burkholderia seminalis]
MGSGFNPASKRGPVQNKMQYESVLSVLSETRADPRAISVVGGNAADLPGYFIEPTIGTGLSEGSRLVDQETFGPVLPVLRFDDEDAAIAKVNAGAYGLRASVCSSDIGAAQIIAAKLIAGTVSINRHVGVDPLVSFGGTNEWGADGSSERAGCFPSQRPALYTPRSA